jgi:hypothetical protein
MGDQLLNKMEFVMEIVKKRKKERKKERKKKTFVKSNNLREKLLYTDSWNLS